MSDVEVDLEVLNYVDQEHQIPINLGDAILERQTLVIKKHWSCEPEKFDNTKKLLKILLIPQKCGEIFVPKLNRGMLQQQNTRLRKED